MLLPVISAVVMLNIFSTIGPNAKSNEVERGNAYVDKIVTDLIENHGDEYDPYPLEDSRVGFSRKVVFVNVSGEAKLFNGHVSGIRTLHREGDSEVTKKDGRIYVKSNLGVGVVNLYYDGTVKFMNFGPSVKIHGSVNYIAVYPEFSVDAKTGKDGKLHKFKIDDLRGMKVTITGLGPLNWALNPILTGVTKIFKNKIKNLLENKIEEHIHKKLPDYQFPLDDIDEVTSGTDSSIGEEVSETMNPEVTTEEQNTEGETQQTTEETEGPTEETTEAEETSESVAESETEVQQTTEETEGPTQQTTEAEETSESVAESETEVQQTTEETEVPTDESTAIEETSEPVAD